MTGRKSVSSRLIDAAEVLLKECGPREMTMEAIASLAGVSLPNAYETFETTEKLLEATYARYFGRLERPGTKVRIVTREELPEILGDFAIPKQARSIETLQRLLNAAEELLEEGGLDAATVPAIAHRAGVSVGVVYRRFPDKDALLRAVYERFLGRGRDQNTTAMESVKRLDLPLPTLLRGVIHGMVLTYRRKRNLLRALHRFAHDHADPEFRKSAADMNRATTAALTEVMLVHREQIAHPNPDRAIEFAVLTIAAILQSVILDEHAAPGLRAPENLEEELVRMMGAYLGVSSRA